MNCPNGHGPMTEGRRFWICEECNYRVERTATGPLTEASQSLLGGLPSPIAIPWGDLFAENNSVLRLYRLCDAAEITVRFLTITALSETRRSLGDNAPLPNDLLQDLQPNIERPTFGRWWSMLRTLSSSLPGRSDLVLPELIDFVTSSLMPLLDGKDAHSSLISLRNELHHSGGLPLAATQQFLDEWMPRVQALLGSLAFLAQAHLRFTQEDQSYPLTGPLAPTGPGGTGRVLLNRGDKALELWPLLDYGPGLADPNTTRSGLMPSGPRVFLRADRDRLLFAALGVDPWQGESRESLAGFRALFRLDQQKSLAASKAPADFEQEIRADADALIGRVGDLKSAKDAIQETQSGVLWIGGPGGMGKSFLMAKMAADLSHGSQNCRLAWRFRAGDAARCSRVAFLRYAVGVLSQWKPLQAEDTFSPSSDPVELQAQLTSLLDRAGVLPAPDPRSRPPRILLFLDGLDEIERMDPSFACLPFDLVRPNVVWVCAGRPERTLPAVFAGDRCQHVFAGGLPPMEGKDIRVMLLEETGPFKYALLAQDAEKSGEVSNAIIAAIAEQAEGLPLYVRLVISDIVSGHFHFSDVAQKLPPGLSAYYDDLLLRLGIGDLQAILTPLVVTLAWAFSPLDEEALLYLMAERRLLAVDEDGRVLLRQGLEAIRSMVRMAPGSDGGFGYEPYHLTFREHIQTDNAGKLKQQNFQAKDQFCRVTIGWEGTPAGSPVYRYALQFGTKHLHDAQRWDDLYALARSEPFLQEQSSVLVRDPDAPLETLRLALQGAMAQDDAAKMGEFVISHAQWLQAMMQETPLSALRNEGLERAWKLADLYGIEMKVLWYLLLAWELKGDGRDAERKNTLERLDPANLPQLTNSQASTLLMQACDPDEAVFESLSQKLANRDRHYADVSIRLASQNDNVKALRFAVRVEDKQQKALVLEAIISSQIAGADFDGALATILLAEDSLEEALEALLEVARSAVPKANKKVAGEALRQATDLASKIGNAFERFKDAYQQGMVTHAMYDAGYSSMSQVRYLCDVVRRMFDDDLDDGFGIYGLAYNDAQELNEPKDQVQAFIKIAQAKAQEEDAYDSSYGFRQALEAASDLEDVGEWIDGLKNIAVAQIQADLVEDAIKTLDTLDQSWHNPISDYTESVQVKIADMQTSVIKALSEAGQYTRALEAATEIGDKQKQLFVRLQTASTYAQSGMLPESLEELRQARELAQSFYGAQRVEVLFQIAAIELHSGEGKVSRDHFADALQYQSSSSDGHYPGYRKKELLVSIAKIQVDAGISDAARRTISLVDCDTSIAGYAFLLKLQAKVGLLVDIEKAAEKMIDLFHHLAAMNSDDWEFWDDWETVNEALFEFTGAQIHAGNLDQACETIDLTPDSVWRSAAIVKLVEAYVKNGDLERAREVADAIFDDEDFKEAQKWLALGEVQERAALEESPQSQEAFAQLQASEMHTSKIETSQQDLEIAHEAAEAADAVVLHKISRITDIDERVAALWHWAMTAPSLAVPSKKWQEKGTPLSLSWLNYMEDLSGISVLNILRDIITELMNASAVPTKRINVYLQDIHGASDTRETIERILLDFATAKNCSGALCDMVKAFMEAGDNERAKQALPTRQQIMKIEDKDKRIKTLCKVSILQVDLGLDADAVENALLMSQEGSGGEVFEVASAFAHAGKPDCLKRLIPALGRSGDAAFRVWELLIRLFPDQGHFLAIAIAEQQ